MCEHPHQDRFYGDGSTPDVIWCTVCGAVRLEGYPWESPTDPVRAVAEPSARERRLVEATAEIDRIWSEERFDRGNFAVWLRQFENAMHAAHAALAAYGPEPEGRAK